ncbi:DUF2493 domain-containing protein [Streptomyces sparsogenes]|uniref:DUF2493 domain-containing protein n=1 Tax=Streptomyces sparsogenes TaxID=67365 RepID=UPI0033F737D1
MSHLRVLVTGSRTWTDTDTIHNALVAAWTDAVEADYDGITVIHGGAAGADTIADQWARAHRSDGVQVKKYDADWEGPCTDTCPPNHRKARRDGTEYCPFAGHRRNQQMVDTAPVVLAFQRAGSTGTADCIRRAEKAGALVRRWTA